MLNAAGLLDVSEFEVFQLAWMHWHGGPPADEEVEPIFVRYMFHRTVPPWVRSFSRMVEQRGHAGTLDGAALGVRRLRRSRRMVRKGVRYTVVIVTVLLAVVVLAQFVSQLLRIAERCLFPPCY